MLAILVPVLARPHRVQPLLESIAATTTNYTVLFLTTPDDYEEREAIVAASARFLDVPMERRGDYARKINAGVAATTHPYVFLAADDLQFHPNWFDRAADKMRGRIGVVGTNDLGNPSVLAGDHATHCLVAREYVAQGTIDENGKLLHEGYAHNFVDNELVETAKTRSAWAFASDSIVEHMHPSWGKAKRDATYNLGRGRFESDRRLFHRRQPLWTSPSS